MRWTDAGWRIVSSDDTGATTASRGPFPEIEDVEAELRTPTDDTGNDDDTIRNLVQEGLVHRGLSSTRQWIEGTDEWGGQSAWRQSANRFDPRLIPTEEFGYMHERFDNVLAAIRAREAWESRNPMGTIHARVRHPGPRCRNQGANSGEEFRDDVLIPQVKTHRANGETIRVALDDAEFGYPTGWLEEVFGGLIRRMPEITHGQVTPVSTKHPKQAAEAMRYMQEAESRRAGTHEEEERDRWN